MFKWLFQHFNFIVRNLPSKLMVAAGFSMVTGAAVLVAVVQALNTARDYIAGIPGEVLQIILLAGAGQGLSIIGAAIVTKMTWDSVKPGMVWNKPTPSGTGTVYV